MIGKRGKYAFACGIYRYLLAILLFFSASAIALADDLPRRLPAAEALNFSVRPVQYAEELPESLPSTSMAAPEEIIAPSHEGASEPIPQQSLYGTTEFEGLQTPDSQENFSQVYGDGSEFVVNYDECADCLAGAQPWVPQILPDGIIYHSYLAGPKEPRFAGVFWTDKNHGWQLDYTVGGRLGLFRYGTTNNFWPEGWEVDVEGAAFPRVNLEEEMDLDSADYRVGIPVTYGIGRWQSKLAVYHLSAHVGDEYLVRNPNFQRINYVRDALVLGQSFYPIEDIRLYGEVEWAFHTDGGAKPWAFQFGAEYSPLRATGWRGAPFAAVNAYLRQDVDYGGTFNFQTGWQWRGQGNRRLLRTGFHLQNGESNQLEFFAQSEQQLGIGIWYDY